MRGHANTLLILESSLSASAVSLPFVVPPYCFDSIKNKSVLSHAWGHWSVSSSQLFCPSEASLVSLILPPCPPPPWATSGTSVGPKYWPISSPTVCVLCLRALTFLLFGDCFSSLLLQKIDMLTSGNSWIWRLGLRLEAWSGRLGTYSFRAISFFISKVKYICSLQFAMNLLTQDEIDLFYKWTRNWGVKGLECASYRFPRNAWHVQSAHTFFSVFPIFSEIILTCFV